MSCEARRANNALWYCIQMVLISCKRCFFACFANIKHIHSVSTVFWLTLFFFCSDFFPFFVVCLCVCVCISVFASFCLFSCLPILLFILHIHMESTRTALITGKWAYGNGSIQYVVKRDFCTLNCFHSWISFALMPIFVRYKSSFGKTILNGECGRLRAIGR